MPLPQVSQQLTATVTAPETPALLYCQAQTLETEGAIPEAITAYRRAVATAEAWADQPTLIRALCRLAILLHHANQSAEARELAERSREVALTAGDRIRAAEAVNALAGIALELGELDSAKALYDEAATLGADDPGVLGRVAQNLGIIANVRGEWDDARAHYDQALTAFQTAGDEPRTAIAYHNLGLINTHRGDRAAAEQNLEDSRAIAHRLGDIRLEGMACLNLPRTSSNRGDPNRPKPGSSPRWPFSPNSAPIASRPMPIGC